MGKTIAERLRESADEKFGCYIDNIADAVTGEVASCFGDCVECRREWYRRLADAIEAEQNASKPKELPEGVIWPRFEDGTPVKFGDEFVKKSGDVVTLNHIHFFNDNAQLNLGDFIEYGERLKRPEPEVLDADGVPIKAGDTVWYEDKAWRVTDVHGWSDGAGGVNLESFIKDEYDESVKAIKSAWNKLITHRKPDTKESVRAEIVKAVKADYAVNLLPLFERYEQVVLREVGEQ